MKKGRKIQSRKTQLTSLSGFTLFDILWAEAMVAPVASGVACGARGGIPYVLCGLGLGIWIGIGFTILFCKVGKKVESPFVPLLTLCGALFLGPLSTGWTVTLLVTTKPVPGLAIALLAVISLWDAIYFVKRQFQRLTSKSS